MKKYRLQLTAAIMMVVAFVALAGWAGDMDFCDQVILNMTQEQYDSLPEDTYHMFIDSELFDGSLTYGELIIPGESEKEILTLYTKELNLNTLPVLELVDYIITFNDINEDAVSKYIEFNNIKDFDYNLYDYKNYV